jgi:chondroitin AC lyase
MKGKVYVTVLLSLLFTCASLTCATGRPSKSGGENLFDTIMNRICTENENPIVIASLHSSVAGALSVYQADGSFSDIDYATREGRTERWKPLKHINRVYDFVFAYTLPGSNYYGDKTLYNKIVRALYYWYDRNPGCENWWYNQIAEPQRLGILLIRMRKGKKQLPPALVTSTLERMRADGGNPAKQTGANKTDIALHWLYRACLTADTALLSTTLTQAYSGLKYASPADEGLQADGSNFQHGTQLYIGGYGDDFIKGVTLFALYTAGTEYALTGDALILLSRFIRETWLKTIRGQYMLWDVSGRGILSRKGESLKQQSAAYPERMLKIDPGHAEEYRAAIKRLQAEEPPHYAVENRNRHYYIGDYTLHNRKNYTFDVRLVSTRTKHIEYGNGENLKTFFASDGCTNIVVKGDEYKDIFPVWNWTRIPGVTCPQVTNIPLSKSDWQQAGISTFAGGISDSLYAVTGYAYDGSYTGNSAKKAYFFFDNEVVCLGSDITSAVPSNDYVTAATANFIRAADEFDINTTVNQCLLDGPVTVSSGGVASVLSTQGEHSYAAAPDWVLHGGVGYVFPQGGVVGLSNQMQTGNWREINTSQEDAVVNKDVFSLWFNHGKAAHKAQYAYVVVPDKYTAAEMDDYVAGNPIEILANTDSVQVVHHKQLNIWGMVFYKAARFEHSDFSIQTDKGCILLVDGSTVHATYPAQSHPSSTATVNWRSFLSQHDMYWDSIPADYYAGALMGNGLLGTNFYKSGTQAYRLDVGRVDITEGRSELPEDVYTQGSLLYDEARLPVGHFLLTPQGNTITGDTMRLSLYDAGTTGVIQTDAGRIDFKTCVHAEKNYILFESVADAGEQDYSWTFNALEAISPRWVNNSPDKSQQTGYAAHPNPAVKTRTDGEYHLVIQNLFCGKTYVVAWKEVKNSNRRRILATISQEASEVQAVAVAKQTIDEGWSVNPLTLEATHTQWWHRYYPASFITFADAQIERFYWTQIYKFACASRPGQFIADLQGPWAVQKTPWPCIWLNLNIQLTYSWQYAANRSELTLPLWKALNDHRDELQNNVTSVPGQSSWTDAIAIGRSSSYNLKKTLDPALTAVNQYEVGNLTWILFYYWQYCVYNNRQEELTTQFFDLLKRAVNYYIHIRVQSGDAYHLPPTSTPEYGVSPADCNYDLALLRWGLQTLLTIDRQYQLHDEKASIWQDFLDRLVDYPASPGRGYNLGAGAEFKSSHRHYSHLLMIYPLYLVNWEQPDKQDIISKSIQNWQSLDKYMQGYSFTGSAAMYASMGDGDRALAQLHKLMSKYIQKNTLYKESGPVIETPLAAVASLHDLYLQSWGGIIRVFPAVPRAWENASFIDLRTEGAFLISAERANSQTVFIQVKSEAGGVCRLQTGMNVNRLKVQTPAGAKVAYQVIDAGKGLIEINTSAGDTVQIDGSTFTGSNAKITIK